MYVFMVKPFMSVKPYEVLPWTNALRTLLDVLGSLDRTAIYILGAKLRLIEPTDLLVLNDVYELQIQIQLYNNYVFNIIANSTKCRYMNIRTYI